jgi:hypothetical protein
LLQIEYIKTVLDIIVNGYANNLITENIESKLRSILDTELFKNCINNLFQFEYNNLYQRIFEQIILILVNKHTPKIIIDHLFVELDLPSTLIKNCEKNLNFKFKRYY